MIGDSGAACGQKKEKGEFLLMHLILAIEGPPFFSNREGLIITTFFDIINLIWPPLI